MIEAVVWGFLGGFAMLLGAFIGFRTHPSSAIVGRVMAFGAGTLVCAVTLELTLEAFDEARGAVFVLGLLAGTGAYYLGDRIIERRLGTIDIDAEPGDADAPEMGNALKVVLGSVLDGVPESAAIGLSIASGGTVSVALLVAVFVSNVPEGLMPSLDMEASGISRRRIYGMWFALAIVCTLSSVFGYAVLGSLPDPIDAFAEAFAAGAILTMLVMVFLVEAVQRAGRAVGIWTILGYALATLLTVIQR
ncbi:MAG: ZIP family zinc transporter [Acidimicrobiia bacterium]|jgi:zinc transporter, ZIP family